MSEVIREELAQNNSSENERRQEGISNQDVNDCYNLGFFDVVIVDEFVLE